MESVRRLVRCSDAGAHGDSSLLEQVRNGSLVILGIALAIGLFVAVSVALSVLPLEFPFVDVLGSLLLTAVLGLATNASRFGAYGMIGAVLCEARLETG